MRRRDGHRRRLPAVAVQSAAWTPDSEVVLQPEHHLACADFRAGNLSEGCRPEARVRITEDRVIEDVLRLDSELEPLTRTNLDVLHQHGVEDLDGRPAIAECPRGGSGHI